MSESDPSEFQTWDNDPQAESSGQSRKHEPAHCFKWVHILMTIKPFYTSFP